MLNANELSQEPVEIANNTLQVFQNGPGWIFWAISLSILVALVSIATQRVIAKKRAAYDYLSRIKNDPKYYEDQQIFLELVESDSLLGIVDSKTKRSNEELLAVKSYLNYFELLCVSIEFHIIDENVCKAYLGDILVLRWDAAELLVLAARKAAKAGTGDEEILEYFETVAKRWKAQPKIEEKNMALRLIEELIHL